MNFEFSSSLCLLKNTERRDAILKKRLKYFQLIYKACSSKFADVCKEALELY